MRRLIRWPDFWDHEVDRRDIVFDEGLLTKVALNGQFGRDIGHEAMSQRLVSRCEVILSCDTARAVSVGRICGWLGGRSTALAASLARHRANICGCLGRCIAGRFRTRADNGGHAHLGDEHQESQDYAYCPVH